MKNFSEFINYFEILALDHKDISDFIYGDSEKILSAERSALSYPVFWMESPEVSPYQGEGDDEKMNFSTSFVILHHAPPENWIEQKYRLSQTFDIATELWRKIAQDAAENDLFEIQINSLDLHPVHNYNNDSEIGWRVSVDLILREDECLPDKFLGTCPPGALAKFTWDNASAGALDVTFVDASNPSTGWTTEWAWKIDDGAEVTSGTPPGITDPGQKLFIELRLTLGGCSLVASAFIFPGINQGQSVPFKITF